MHVNVSRSDSQTLPARGVADRSAPTPDSHAVGSAEGGPRFASLTNFW